MANNKFMHGSSLLMGDSTVPGLKLPDDLKALLPTVFKKVREFGCEYYDTVVQMLTYDEISEVAAYGGFPVRFPHWKFGMEYEELQRGYEHGMHRIYEMVINTNPCYIYCLDSNTMVDNVTVVAHALGHCDFFANNIFFSPTSQNMLNQLANHGTRIRRYMQRWGKEKVTEFIDHVLRIETLIDSTKAWDKKKIKDVVIRDHRVYKQPPRINVRDEHEYMEEYMNPPEWKKAQRAKVDRADAAREVGVFGRPTKDIMGFLRDKAPLKPWQADIISMLYEESMYFAPQRMTKTINEGWASFIDYKMMCEQGMCGLGQKGDDFGIVEYSKHKMGVLGGKYSMNPYKLGYCLFLDIEERWNKGQFGEEWEECKDIQVREKWDKKLGLGHDKVFEVRKYYDDLTLLNEFFTEDFMNKYEFFEWKKYPNGETRIESRDYKTIKKKLMERHINGGLPDVRLTEPNFKGRGEMFLQHFSYGKELYEPYVKATLQSLAAIWQQPVHLSTITADGDEFIFTAYDSGDDDLTYRTREEFESEE